MKKQAGVTLIALVITIIVLIILAGVAINTITGKESIIKNAENAVAKYNEQKETEEELLNALAEYLEDYRPKSELELLEGVQEKTVTVSDAKGNKVKVPGGFRVRTDIATTVQQGIVIEDEIGNQFVWIPIEDVVKDDGSKINIQFGRYSQGVIQQSADNYEEIVEIAKDYYLKMYELSTFRESDFNKIGSTSYNLGEFITKTKANKGFYIARYAGTLADTTGITSGYTKGSPAVTDQVPTFAGETYTKNIRQGDAATACRNLYEGNDFVASDLINSYASDTAAKYIELCEKNDNYCNMEFTYREWTTESLSDNGTEKGCVYNQNGFSGRTSTNDATDNQSVGFRAVLYVK